jgi:hypothetical protein
MVKRMQWAELGKSYPGYTEALIFKSRLTEKSNSDFVKAVMAGEDIQNSVRMQYVSLSFAVNSDKTDFKEEKAVWDRYYSDIANKDAADEAGYFWAITEAKIYKEGSAVLFGANDATPILYTEPKAEPPASTLNWLKQLQII